MTGKSWAEPWRIKVSMVPAIVVDVITRWPARRKIADSACTMSSLSTTNRISSDCTQFI